jgi:beta-glucanase (GH16 family)
MNYKSLSVIGLTTGLVSAGERLVLNEQFRTLNKNLWNHEITMGAADGSEFEMYVDDRRNSYVKDGVLYLKPTLTTDAISEDQMKHGSFKLEDCNEPRLWGCERNAAASGIYINPIRSARVNTKGTFEMKYGRVEITAKMPKGDWLWPAIWMLPSDLKFGEWPRSGEIDIVETKGNSPDCPSGGRDSFGSTLHYGNDWNKDYWNKAHAEFKGEDLSEDFHVYGLEWDENHIKTTIDGKTVLNY